MSLLPPVFRNACFCRDYKGNWKFASLSVGIGQVKRRIWNDVPFSNRRGVAWSRPYQYGRPENRDCLRNRVWEIRISQANLEAEREWEEISARAVTGAEEASKKAASVQIPKQLEQTIEGTVISFSSYAEDRAGYRRWDSFIKSYPPMDCDYGRHLYLPTKASKANYPNNSCIHLPIFIGKCGEPTWWSAFYNGRSG